MACGACTPACLAGHRETEAHRWRDAARCCCKAVHLRCRWPAVSATVRTPAGSMRSLLLACAHAACFSPACPRLAPHAAPTPTPPPQQAVHQAQREQVDADCAAAAGGRRSGRRRFLCSAGKAMHGVQPGGVQSCPSAAPACRWRIAAVVLGLLTSMPLSCLPTWPAVHHSRAAGHLVASSQVW